MAVHRSKIHQEANVYKIKQMFTNVYKDQCSLRAEL